MVLWTSVLVSLMASAIATEVTCEPGNADDSIYDYETFNIYQNDTVQFAEYSGRVMAFVNVVRVQLRTYKCVEWQY